jgi:hypothetical protein
MRRTNDCHPGRSSNVETTVARRLGLSPFASTVANKNKRSLDGFAIGQYLPSHTGSKLVLPAGGFVLVDCSIPGRRVLVSLWVRRAFRDSPCSRIQVTRRPTQEDIAAHKQYADTGHQERENRQSAARNTVGFLRLFHVAKPRRER